MTGQIVFLTLYLGLISGPKPVRVQVSPDVKSVRILIDGREAAAIKAAPWSAMVDLGSSFEPRELVAVAYDRDGGETGRTSQIINLPRQPAELTIALETGDQGVPVAATLRWEHVLAAKPTGATITIDGQKTQTDQKFHARLPRLDAAHPHVIAAEMHFEDGFVARSELVIAGGAVASFISTELTPVLFSGKPPGKLDGCLTSKGSPVETRAVETPAADVFVVRDPDVAEVRAALNSTRLSFLGSRNSQLARDWMSLDPGTSMRFVWPVAQQIEDPGHIPANVFQTSEAASSNGVGMLAFVTNTFDRANGTVRRSVLDPKSNPRRFADAVAVAGINAVAAAHRRAVVLVLSKSVDTSRAQPAGVRHYLSSIGVPLFVWSPTGPRPDLGNSWGDVDDVSDPRRFQMAVQRLRASLGSQHVAWVASDPITALRAEADPRCGITPLAHLGR
ncbi:MAG TPA: hypothetical protein VHX14_10870 [Thermoanaerobaculia bacterium]|nr:hypothetical protein [Thermoanaerobaculia bacterium]